MGDEPSPKRHAAFDSIDILLAYVTICAGFGVASVLHLSDSSRLFKYVMAAALVAVVVARRAVFGPPRVAAVRRGSSALGLLGVASLLFGLIIGTGGGVFLYGEITTPTPEPTKTDHDAIERQIDLPALARKCTRDGKPARGRACMTAEERASEAAEDEKNYAAERAKYETEKAGRVARYWQIMGVGTLLVLIGIVLDVLRTRRDAAPVESGGQVS